MNNKIKQVLSLIQTLYGIEQLKDDAYIKDYYKLVSVLNAQLVGIQSIDYNKQFILYIPIKVDKRRGQNSIVDKITTELYSIFDIKPTIAGTNIRTYLHSNMSKSDLKLVSEVKNKFINENISKILNNLCLKQLKYIEQIDLDFTNISISEINHQLKEQLINLMLTDALTSNKTLKKDGFNDYLVITFQNYKNFESFVTDCLNTSQEDFKYYKDLLIENKVEINNLLNNIYSNAKLHKSINKITKSSNQLTSLLEVYNKEVSQLNSIFENNDLGEKHSETFNRFENMLLDLFKQRVKKVDTITNSEIGNVRMTAAQAESILDSIGRGVTIGTSNNSNTNMWVPPIIEMEDLDFSDNNSTDALNTRISTYIHDNNFRTSITHREYSNNSEYISETLLRSRLPGRILTSYLSMSTEVNQSGRLAESFRPNNITEDVYDEVFDNIDTLTNSDFIILMITCIGRIMSVANVSLLYEQLLQRYLPTPPMHYNLLNVLRSDLNRFNRSLERLQEYDLEDPIEFNPLVDIGNRISPVATLYNYFSRVQTENNNALGLATAFERYLEFMDNREEELVTTDFRSGPEEDTVTEDRLVEEPRETGPIEEEVREIPF